MRPLSTLLLVSLTGLSACTSDETLRLDGMTIGAGEAIAANSAMQMVDPWPRGVEDTSLETPASRKPSSAAGSPGPAHASTNP